MYRKMIMLQKHWAGRIILIGIVSPRERTKISLSAYRVKAWLVT